MPASDGEHEGCGMGKMGEIGFYSRSGLILRMSHLGLGLSRNRGWGEHHSSSSEKLGYVPERVGEKETRTEPREARCREQGPGRVFSQRVRLIRSFTLQVVARVLYRTFRLPASSSYPSPPPFPRGLALPCHTCLDHDC